MLCPTLSPYSHFDYAKFGSVDRKYCLLIPLIATTNLPNIESLLGELLAPLVYFVNFFNHVLMFCKSYCKEIILTNNFQQ